MSMSFLWPNIVGHRGSAGTTPENTLISVREAHDSGIRAVEFDVMLARDGIPVVFHDATLDRTTDGAGPVSQLTSAELKQLDAGSWFLPQFAGEPIPTLEEMLRLCLSLGLLVNIEIKSEPGRERDTVAAVVDIAENLWLAGHPPPLISSFSINSLIAAREVRPEWPRGLILPQRAPEWRNLVELADPTTLAADARAPVLLLELVATGKPVFSYTINEVKRARSLFALGIAGIFSDYPAQMLSQSIWLRYAS